MNVESTQPRAHTQQPIRGRVCVMAPTGTFTRVALLPSLPSADSRLGIWGLYNEASSRRHSASAPAGGALSLCLIHVSELHAQRIHLRAFI